MVDASPEFENRDLKGSTVHYNGTVGTSSTAVPTIADSVISELTIANPRSNLPTTNLFISFDGGTNFKTIPWNSEFAWSPKGNKKQIHIKASSASTPYEIVMNFEEA